MLELRKETFFEPKSTHFSCLVQTSRLTGFRAREQEAYVGIADVPSVDA